MMCRIHPAENRCQNLLTPKKPEEDAHERPPPPPPVLTVWKRSSLSFHGTDGFTVFDHRGILTFRVDNYKRSSSSCIAAGGKGIVLMDGAGKPLLTLEPQIFSMQYQWNGYRGEDECGKSPKSRVFTMRRPSVLIPRRTFEAEVFTGAPKMKRQMPDFRIEGSFRRRNCEIKNQNGKVIAKMARKKVNTTIMLSDDVFSLVIQPGTNTELVMAFVLILDRMSGNPFAPVLCQ